MIPLTVTEVTASLQRILVFFFPEPKEQIGYITTVHEAVATKCTPELFNRACQIVAETMRPRKKPVPSEYLDAIRGLQSLARKPDGTRDHPSSPMPGCVCDLCKAWHYDYMVTEAERMSPNGSCSILKSKNVESLPDHIVKILMERTATEREKA